MHVCMRPTEAACFCVQKCANNHQLIVADVQSFYDTHAQLTSVLYKHAKCHVRYIYIYMQTLIGIFYVHRNGNMHVCLTRG